LSANNKILTTDLIKSKIYESLEIYKDPYLPKDIVSCNCVKEIIINSREVIVNLQFGFISNRYQQDLYKKIYNIIKPVIKSLAAEVEIDLVLNLNIINKVLTHAYKKSIDKIPRIKNIIAVGSGKGGVGKSTVAVNIALALQEQGAKVGILDADLYGPSLPHMLGTPEKIKVVDKKFIPHTAYGLHCISIGNLLEQDAPVIWRGPMVSGGLLQLLNDTHWPELDYLIIDLPPGTGDIQLTLTQKIPVSGAIIVTTPQPVALLDAKKALLMFEKLNISVLGVVENMSKFICTNCSQQHDIFGTTGGKSLASEYDLRLLGDIPLDLNIRQQSDLGTPAVLALPGSDISNSYHNIATKVAAQLSILPIDLKLDASQIVIDSSNE
jgi:ATP-binding protein involved in chromosome partitioning